MSSTQLAHDERQRISTTSVIVGATLALLVVLVALTWAKWQPYGAKVVGLNHTRTWDGSAILAPAHGLGGIPSLATTGSFVSTYFGAVWKALLAALLIAAAVETFLPTTRLVGFLARRSAGSQAVAGGLASLPTMMCTCCTAPVAVGLARRGAPRAACLAYWVGNPLLNPAVVVFLLLVFPWQFAAVRVGFGAILVLLVPVLLARLATRASSSPSSEVPADVPPPLRRPADLVEGYLRSLLRLSVTLVPEYVAVVLVVGWLMSGVGSFESIDARLGLAAVLVVAILGTLFVIPTGGEIPVVLGLLASGASMSVAGAVLITLPALSIPSIIMVGRSLSWRPTFLMAGSVMLAGVAAGATLTVLT